MKRSICDGAGGSAQKRTRDHVDIHDRRSRIGKGLAYGMDNGGISPNWVWFVFYLCTLYCNYIVPDEALHDLLYFLFPLQL